MQGEKEKKTKKWGGGHIISQLKLTESNLEGGSNIYLNKGLEEIIYQVLAQSLRKLYVLTL